MKIVIFGPPGSGKSTLIEFYNSRKPGSAFDLELIWHEKEKLKETLEKPYIFYGGAGFDREILTGYKGKIIPIILTLPENEYVAQRDERDKKRPEKKDQVPLQGALHHMSEGAKECFPVHPNDAKRLVAYVDFFPIFSKSTNSTPLFQWLVRELASKDIPDRKDFETKVGELDPNLLTDTLTLYDRLYPSKPNQPTENLNQNKDKSENEKEKQNDKEVKIPAIAEKNQVVLKMPPDELIHKAFPPEVSTRALLAGFEEEKLEFRKAKTDLEILGELADIAGYSAALKKIKPSEIPAIVLKALEIKYLTRQECYSKIGVSRGGYRSPRKLAQTDEHLAIAREYLGKEECELQKLLPLSVSLKRWGKTLCI